MGQVSVEQARYQVRFDWGAVGIASIGTDADAIIWVDSTGDRQPPAAAPACAVVRTAMPTAAAAAAWLLALQRRLGRRAMVAVVGADDRFSATDLLAAGAVIAALTDLGIDATSPEAATAEAAYRGLRPAVAHLASAAVRPVPTHLRRLDPAATADDVEVLRAHPDAD